MLSRTAESLFWLGRYTERAANLARALAVASRMASLSDELKAENDQWRPLVVAAGCEAAFFERHRAATEENVVDFLVRDAANLSGIIACFSAARQNGRSVRTALTVDMWSALSDSWTRLRSMTPADYQGEKLPGFLEWVRERVLLFNGAAMDTMLRGEAWMFIQLGTALERADATARLLDVKHDLLSAGGEESTVQHGQCQSVLQSVSALRAYHWTYRERIDPVRVAEFLILRPEMPRSLAACYDRVVELLEMIATVQGGRRGECHRLAGKAQARLRYGRIEEILASGLHDYLTEMIEGVSTLGSEIEAFYIRA